MATVFKWMLRFAGLLGLVGAVVAVLIWDAIRSRPVSDIEIVALLAESGQLMRSCTIRTQETKDKRLCLDVVEHERRTRWRELRSAMLRSNSGWHTWTGIHGQRHDDSYVSLDNGGKLHVRIYPDSLQIIQTKSNSLQRSLTQSQRDEIKLLLD